MLEIERKLLTLFDLLHWDCLYQPYRFCDVAGGGIFEPSFYIPAIRLFISCDEERNRTIIQGPGDFLERLITDGECWRVIPGCPKPVEDNFRMADLILQPSLLRIPAKGTEEYIQFRDAPGSPRSSTGVLFISRCESCKEWSPDPDGADYCRACGKREKGAHFFIKTADTPKLCIMSGWAEDIEIPERGRYAEAVNGSLLAHQGEYEAQSVRSRNLRGLFERFVIGPPSTETSREKATFGKRVAVD